ncbi:RNA polymerase sigma factor [uncultured Fibrella sp.]|uniref:RNA polymerase sigma factor n=1 Tax=uncultured Fibrella sp. TaxID=1284596 RepID=UPI0035CBB93A
MSPNRSPFKDESILIEHLRHRDERAFRWLYRKYSVTLLVHILKFVHDPEQARDVLQDVFIKIWQHLNRFDTGKGRLFTWMCNIARNTAIDVVRASKTKGQPTAVQLMSIDDDNRYYIEQQYWTPAINLDHIGLSQLIDRLQPQHQQLVKLIYVDGYTQLEAATELAVPVGTVKTRLRVALRLLRHSV